MFLAKNLKLKVLSLYAVYFVVISCILNFTCTCLPQEENTISTNYKLSTIYSFYNIKL